MAKIAFSKLNIKNETNTQVIRWPVKDATIDIEVIQYLPMVKKLELVSQIINASADENGYYNPMKIKIYTVLGIVFSYTNLTFTEKQKEDACKLYDSFVQSGLYQQVIAAIDTDEYKMINKSIWETIRSIYEYKNSVMGVLDNVSKNYSNLDVDVQQIMDNIRNMNSDDNFELLRDIMEKLD